MIYKVYTMKSDGWSTKYVENVRCVSAESEEEAKEIYKKAFKPSRKKIYAEISNKKGIVIFDS